MTIKNFCSHLENLEFREYYSQSNELIYSEIFCPTCHKTRKAMGDDLPYFQNHPQQVKKISMYPKRKPSF